jgi:hypothetical protein
MNITHTSPTTNVLARQNLYIRPRFNPINQVNQVTHQYVIDSSDDTITLTDSNSNKSSVFSSNDSLSSFEDYRVNLYLEKDNYNKVSSIPNISDCNRGVMSSICCNWCYCSHK